MTTYFKHDKVERGVVLFIPEKINLLISNNKLPTSTVITVIIS